MAQRLKAWPPGGGSPVEVYELDAARLVLKGWTLNAAATKAVKAAAETESAEESATDETATDEGLTDGNN